MAVDDDGALLPVVETSVSDPGAAPPPPPPPFSPEPAPAPTFPRWGWWAIAVSAVVSIVVIAGFVIHVPYATISPGEAVSLPPLVQVQGTVVHPEDRGDIRLLFVRERNHVNLWRYLQARLDGDIDLYKEQQLNPEKKTQSQLNDEAAQQMADAKTAATKVALEAAGFKVRTAPGVTVSDVSEKLPASKVLQPGDVIMTADGHKITRSTDLTDAIQARRVGDDVVLEIVRDGKPKTVRVAVGSDGGVKRIGVIASPRFTFPVKVKVDTAGIGGPSAGLAMTLAIFDDLTSGNLTGGKRVAVTGTIDTEGHVDEIGGINQKAVAARAAGATLFIVPACVKDRSPDLAACRRDVKRATQRAGSKVKVVPVSTFDQALKALRDAGGDPAVAQTPTSQAA
jgi:PDZ domain-containing protein